MDIRKSKTSSRGSDPIETGKKFGNWKVIQKTIQLSGNNFLDEKTPKGEATKENKDKLDYIKI